MNRLFNKYTAQNELGNKIADDADEFISNLFEKYKSQNIDLNDFELIVTRTIQTFMAEQRLCYARKLRKLEQQNNDNLFSEKRIISYLERS